jgi:DNA polymerase III epsilon subunit-like protein
MEHLPVLIREVGKRCPRGCLPDSYLVLDLETSGFNYNPKNGSKPDVIAQIGYAAVQGRELVANDAYLFKRPPGTMHGEAMEVTGITDEMLANGREPKEIIPKILELVHLYRDSGCMFVGHNFISFDAHFLHHDFKRDGFDVTFDIDECVDTGMLFKAAQCGVKPAPFESLSRFQARVRSMRRRVKWNLTIAAEILDLEKSHGIDMSGAHDAGFDCKVTHLVFEELRRRAGL